MDRALSGGQVQKIVVGRIGARDVVLLQVRIPGKTAHVVIVGALGIGALDAPTRGRLRDAMTGATATQRLQWRTWIETARVAGLGERSALFIRDGAAWRASSASDGAVVLMPASAEPDDVEPILDEEALLQRGRRIAAEVLACGAGDRREAFRRALKKSTAHLQRRLAAVAGDLAKMAVAEDLAVRARLFVGEAARAPRGTRVLRTVDWSTGAPETIELKLDPAKSAQEQIAAIFRRARRLKEGVQVARTRFDETTRTITSLEALSARLDEPDVDLPELEARARRAAPRDFKLASSPELTPRAARADAARPPYRKFLGASGAAILVGRSAHHNDDLTLHVARPHDVWLHAKGRTGAHIVVPLRKGASCPADLLVEAAHLAAHFSEARGEGVVEVQYVPRRYVRKPRASAPGTVVVDREKVIAVRMREELLRALLAAEVEPAG